jgi:ABC-type lipoprotein release transport system permease subunit
MKCLGALDEFIVRLFLLEAMMLGVLASVIGAIVGTGAMMLLYSGRIGFSGALASWGETAMVVGGRNAPLWAAILVGIFLGGTLSMLAALYPAWRAAKMPPAAALRSEF